MGLGGSSPWHRSAKGVDQQFTVCWGVQPEGTSSSGPGGEEEERDRRSSLRRVESHLTSRQELTGLTAPRRIALLFAERSLAFSPPMSGCPLFALVIYRFICIHKYS